MKILIVGGTSSLAQVLKPVLSQFAEVSTAGRAGCDMRLDLSGTDGAICLPKGFEVVINVAAQFGGNDFDRVLAAENVNVLGALKLCHACTQAEVGHLVQVSSIFAGLGKGSPFYGIYSVSKRHAEEVVQLYGGRFKLPLTILRPAQIYGVGESFRKHQPFLYSIIDKAQRNEEIVFFGSNDARRNFIHAEDVANIIARVVQKRTEGIFSCQNSVNITYSEIARAAIAAFDSASTIRFLRGKPDVADNAFDPDEGLFRRIKYFPRISFALGMKKEADFRRSLQ